mgnify:CR=1 FL=1
MDIVLKSLVSALATALILIIAKFSGAKLAGAIGGVPIVFAISYVLLTMNDRSLSKDFLVGGIYGAVAAIFFSLILIWFNIQFTKSHWLNFAVAYFLCFVLALILVQVSSNSK